MIKRMVILAWIFGILGLAGTIYIFIQIIHPQPGTSNNNGKKIDSPRVVIKADPIVPKTAFTDTQLRAKITKEILDSLNNTITAPVADTIKPIIIDTARTNKPDTIRPVGSKKISSPVKQADKPVEKHLSKLELRKLLSKIRMAKAKHKKMANCVQIYRMAGGKNRIAAAQIERYLTANHYSIAGRETFTNKVKGMSISYHGMCLRLTIGYF